MQAVGAERLARRRRQARRTGLAGLVAAGAVPFLLFRRVIAEVTGEFRLEPGYLSGWLPWILMGVGLLFFLPVALSAGQSPDSRWYPRARNAYAGWGVSLYLLGFAVAWQVAQLTDGPSP